MSQYPMHPQAVAASNALSGEKTFRSVQFAITGDLEVDIISGVLAVCNTQYGTTGISGKHLAFIMEYLKQRFLSEWETQQACSIQYAQQAQPDESINKYMTSTQANQSIAQYWRSIQAHQSSPKSSSGSFPAAGVNAAGGIRFSDPDPPRGNP